MNSDTVRMHRLTLRFADAGLEKTFSEAQARKAIRPVRIALICLSVGAVGFYVLTTYVLQSVLLTASPAVMFSAMGLTLAICSAAYALTRHPAFVRRQQPITLLFVCALSVGATWASSRMPLASLESRGWLMLLLHTLSIYGLFRLRFPHAVLGGWLGVAIYTSYMLQMDLLNGAVAMRHAFTLGLANSLGMVISYQMDVSARREFLAVREAASEHERSERLLHNILPVELAKELSTNGFARSARHESASVLFTDFSGFTQMASAMPADLMVAELNEIFGAFDDICDEIGVEKIKTIGDAYMAAAGLPMPCSDHAQRCVRAGLRMVGYLENRNGTATSKWSLRVGVHSGPVVAGVVGKRKYAFDIWGDTVNVASRMESSGEIGRVNISADTFNLIQAEFECSYRGKVDAKGKGQIDMYFVTGARRT